MNTADKVRTARASDGSRPLRVAASAEDGFDALYADIARSLVHQTYLLTGQRRLAFESVEWAFHHAWEHWPEVAADPDPVIWLRTAAYDYALSPWHRLRPPRRNPDLPVTDATHRALLDLPPPYRRALLLCDGLGFSLDHAAREMQSSTPAATNRLRNARTHIAQRLPAPDDPGAVQQRLHALTDAVSIATVPHARSVRTSSEERTRLQTRTVFAAMGTLLLTIAVAIILTPGH
ncbi:sigma-70 family RNA polymerase sigma factor [Streptomyces sp. NBC_00663]|uniref:RNA polymerase sigma factor n=1 Tax=Streptomyces sp. NBC_00663 TaxID=2975801 RepID=UPI002E33C9E1|nr:sigma factor-like helix-turn-helix DNA-binding protein [Streptomyces sp. NBC_00663]